MDTGLFSPVPQPTGLRDEPIAHADLLPQGMARIDANDGGGAYTITELWWDPQQEQWTAAEGPPGLVEAEATDYAMNCLGQAQQKVRFWEVRALGGEVCRFIDVSGAQGRQKVAAFCAHYAGSSETTGAFYSVVGCLNSLVQIGLDVRLCSDNGLAGDHPGNTRTRLSGGSAGMAFGNTIATWSGDDSQWIDLAYMAVAADGSEIGSGVEAVADFNIQCRVMPAGVLELRVVNDRLPGLYFNACVIAGAVWVTPFGSPPGTIEFGNGEDHEKVDIPEGESVWGDGVWEPRG
jgi:hypothetical protein